MPKHFLFFTTLFLTLLTTSEAFQFTHLFQSSPQKPKMEQTFIAVKPDGVMRGLVGEIISRFEKRGSESIGERGLIVGLSLLR